MRTGILLVDNSKLFLESVAAFLSADPRFVVVGSARSGEEAVELVRRVHPDLVLMDLAMPGIGGLEATRRIRSLPEPPLVLVLTVYALQEYRTAASAAGAAGFVGKAGLGVELIPLIEKLCGLSR